MNLGVSSIFRTRICYRDSKLAWIGLAACVCICCTNLGFLWSFGLFYSSLLKEFDASKEKAAWIGSIPFSLTFFLSPIANWFCAKLGSRLSVVIGSACIGTALVSTSFVNSLDAMFVTFSLIYGIGSSILNIGIIRATNSYFDKRLSTALGLLTGGTGLLHIALTRLLISLLESYRLQKVFRIYAAFSMSICFVSSLVLFPPSDKDAEGGTTKAPSAPTGINAYTCLMKDKVYCLWIITTVIMSLEGCVPAVHQVQVAIEMGVPEKAAKQFPFYFAIGSSIGRICIGPFMDLRKFDKLYVFQGLIFSIALISFVGSFATTQVHLITFIWIFSTVEGAFQSGFYPIIRILFGIEHLSEAISIYLMLTSVTTMLGPPLVGLIVDKTKSYKAFFYVIGTPLLIGFFLLFGVRCLKDFKPFRIDEKINEKLNVDGQCEASRSNKEKLVLLQFETAV